MKAKTLSSSSRSRIFKRRTNSSKERTSSWVPRMSSWKRKTQLWKNKIENWKSKTKSWETLTIRIKSSLFKEQIPKPLSEVTTKFKRIFLELMNKFRMFWRKCICWIWTMNPSNKKMKHSKSRKRKWPRKCHK